MLKKISMAVLMSSSLLASQNVYNGWNMLGVAKDSTPSEILKKYKGAMIWQWDNKNKKWLFYSDIKKLVTLVEQTGKFAKIDKLKQNEGYWLYVGSNFYNSNTTNNGNNTTSTGNNTGFKKADLVGKTLWIVKKNKDANEEEGKDLGYLVYESIEFYNDYIKYNDYDVEHKGKYGYIKAPYEIKDGVIIIYYSKAESFEAVKKYIDEIKEWGADKNKIEYKKNGVIKLEGKDEYLTFDKTKAEEFKELLNMQNKTAWNAKFLDGRTLYTGYKNCWYGAKFKNGYLTYYDILGDMFGYEMKVPYKVVDESGNKADYGKLLKTDESKYNDDGDGIEWYKVLSVDAVKGVIKVADNDQGLKDILSKTDVTQLFFINKGDMIDYMNKWIDNALEQISNTKKFNKNLMTHTYGYLLYKADTKKYVMTTIELMDWGEPEFKYHEVLDDIKIKGSWKVDEDGKIILTYDKDYYGDGDKTETWSVKEVNKEKEYIKIYDGDFYDYMFFNKAKAKDYLKELNSK